MPSTVRPEPNCSIARTLELVGDRWSFLILREAHNGVTRFADFRDLLGIAPNILTARLTSLVEAGILVKREYRDDGARSRASYHLTPKGAGLKLVLGALQQWGDTYAPRSDGPTVVRRNTATGEQIDVAFIDSDGRAVDAEDVSFEPVAGGPADRYSNWR
ncbi:helix-turn-helix domain-containing protein [Leifsonia shinshuensis]|uniref:winged helix-turn-helix transcriptional regulator n=1 Tax=Leifsonia shinshuensis TaxID=150026 RepID=UPI00285C0DC7|nr:helix-turn-helix domain-containing protein [Leifsonia shinshuensis]MDR6973116.1 DNA-binding HxlR family transcriptional regulator [Leifsonia shinshuensis]